MAIYHFAVKSISRGQGHSATAAAAYRAGIAIADARTGVTHDYTKRAGVLAVMMLAPKGAPDWASDPAQLWNQAEAVETRKNARVGREIVLSLPHELNESQRADLAREVGALLVDRYQVAVQVAIHAPDKGGDDRNHHAHILFSGRQIGPEGFGAYAAKAYDDFKAGPVEIKAVREQVANLTNDHLARAGLDARVDHRRLIDQKAAAEARGDIDQAIELDRQPTRKVGKEAERAVRITLENYLIQSENAQHKTAQLDRWNQIKAEAAQEARLMLAASDGPKAAQAALREATAAPTATRTPSHDTRPPFRRPTHGRRLAAITAHSIHSDRLRLGADDRKPLLSVSAMHNDPVDLRSPKFGRGVLRRDEPGHSGFRETVHLVPASPTLGVSAKPAATAAAAPSSSLSPLLIPGAAAPAPVKGATIARGGGGGSRAITAGGSTAGAVGMSRDALEKKGLQEMDALKAQVLAQQEADNAKLTALLSQKSPGPAHAIPDSARPSWAQNGQHSDWLDKSIKERERLNALEQEQKAREQKAHDERERLTRREEQAQKWKQENPRPKGAEKTLDTIKGLLGVRTYDDRRKGIEAQVKKTRHNALDAHEKGFGSDAKAHFKFDQDEQRKRIQELDRDRRKAAPSDLERQAEKLEQQKQERLERKATAEHVRVYEQALAFRQQQQQQQKATGTPGAGSQPAAPGPQPPKPAGPRMR